MLNKKEKKEKKSIAYQILDVVMTFVLTLVFVVILKMFVLDATKVAGNSMLNTLHDGDIIFVNKLEKYMGGYKRGEIVILNAPDFYGRIYIKRIVGVPGDVVELKNNKVYINDKEYKENYISTQKTLQSGDESVWYLADKQYFVMGDNRLPNASNDSRAFGPVNEDAIIGHAFLRFYPLSDIGFVDKE